MQYLAPVFLTACMILIAIGAWRVVAVLRQMAAEKDSAPETQDDFTLAMARWNTMLKDRDQ